MGFCKQYLRPSLLPSREKVTTPGKEEVERSRKPEPRMRVIRIKALAFDILTPTLSLTRERGLLRHLPEGE